MATSGSIDFSLSRDDIITDALELVGALAEGDTPTTDQLTATGRKLNMLVKAMMAKTPNLFAIQRVYLFLTEGTGEYSLAGAKATTSYVQTTLASSAASSATVLSLTDTSDIAVGDKIGIELADGTMHWTTVATGSSTTISDALPSAADAGAVVYAYTTDANRPMNILLAMRRTYSGNEAEVAVYPYQDYARLSNKESSGIVNSIYYDRLVPVSTVYTWPISSNSTDILVLWTQRTLEDFDSGSDTMDFPIEWGMALTYKLAVALAPKYSITAKNFAMLKQLADEYEQEAEGFDRPDYIEFTPELRK